MVDLTLQIGSSGISCVEGPDGAELVASATGL